MHVPVLFSSLNPTAFASSKKSSDVNLVQGLANYSCQGPNSVLGITVHTLSGAFIQLSCCRTKEATDII